MKAFFWKHLKTKCAFSDVSESYSGVACWIHFLADLLCLNSFQAETRAEFAERTVTKLEKSIDDLEGTGPVTLTASFTWGWIQFKSGDVFIDEPQARLNAHVQSHSPPSDLDLRRSVLFQHHWNQFLLSAKEGIFFRMYGNSLPKTCLTSVPCQPCCTEDRMCSDVFRSALFSCWTPR